MSMIDMVITTRSSHPNNYNKPFGLSLSKTNNGKVTAVRQAHRERYRF